MIWNLLWWIDRSLTTFEPMLRCYTTFWDNRTPICPSEAFTCILVFNRLMRLQSLLLCFETGITGSHNWDDFAVQFAWLLELYLLNPVWCPEESESASPLADPTPPSSQTTLFFWWYALLTTTWEINPLLRTARRPSARSSGVVASGHLLASAVINASD